MENTRSSSGTTSTPWHSEPLIGVSLAPQDPSLGKTPAENGFACEKNHKGSGSSVHMPQENGSNFGSNAAAHPEGIKTADPINNILVGKRKLGPPSLKGPMRCCIQGCNATVGNFKKICSHWNSAHAGQSAEIQLSGATFQETSSGRKFRLLDHFPFVVRCKLCKIIRLVKYWW